MRRPAAVALPALGLRSRLPAAEDKTRAMARRTPGVLATAISALTLAIAACAPVTPSPIPTPNATATAFEVEAGWEAYCPAEGSCWLVLQLTGPGGPWRTEVRSAGPGAAMSRDDGMPTTLGPGTYHFSFGRVLLTDLVGGQTLAPNPWSCETPFQVFTGQRASSLAINIDDEPCSIEITMVES